jgi:hypothetical protein
MSVEEARKPQEATSHSGQNDEPQAEVKAGIEHASSPQLTAAAVIRNLPSTLPGFLRADTGYRQGGRNYVLLDSAAL